MPFRDAYHRQAALLMRVLPLIAEEDIFALKGGTAINMFTRDMPRLSVDIDLAYLPVHGRNESLDHSEQARPRVVFKKFRKLSKDRGAAQTVLGIAGVVRFDRDQNLGRAAS